MRMSPRVLRPVVVVPTANWANLTAGAKRRARATLEGMIERDWNHPSIVIWTIINENWGTELALTVRPVNMKNVEP